MMPAASPPVLNISWWQREVLPPVLARSWSSTVVLDCSRTEFRAPMAEVIDALARNPRIRTLVLRSWMFEDLPPLPPTISTLTALTVHGYMYDNASGILAQIQHMAPDVKEPTIPGLGWKLSTDVVIPMPDGFDWGYDMEPHPFENDTRGPGAQPRKGLAAGVCWICQQELGDADILVYSFSLSLLVHI
jgi:hypothetical protein